MLELFIATLYILFGLSLFKIDCHYNITGFLKPYCFENAGFELYILFYLLLSPIVVVYGIFYRLKNSICGKA